MTGPVAPAENRWGILPAETLPWTYNPEVLVVNSAIPNLVESVTSNAQAIFSTDNIELEGNYTFTYTVPADDY